MMNLRHDMWYALRRLIQRPWHTIIVVMIFAVGSGAALTVMRVADAVLLRALPYRAAEELVRVQMRVPMDLSEQALPFSDVGYRILEHRTRAFQSVAAYRTEGVNLSVGNRPLRVLSARVSGNFFSLLGIGVQVGRTFRPGEEAEKGDRLIILSDALWRSEFGSRPEVVGSTVRIDGQASTIVGVADARLTFPVADAGFWALMDLDANGTQPFNLGLNAIARVRSGVSIRTALDDATFAVREFARENPGPHAAPGGDVSGYRANVLALRDDIAGGVKPTILLLTIAVLCVVLLTCVNVATLELTRASARRGELAVRAALGAGQRGLILGALVEGVVLATVGAALGLGASSATVGILRSLLPSAFVGNAGSILSPGVIVAALLMIVVSASASGLFPILFTIRTDIASALRSKNESSTRRLALVRRILIVTQVVFACVLVEGAALMIATVRAAQRVSLGFTPAGLLTFQVSLPRETYRSQSDATTAFQAITEKLRALPGVSEVGLTSVVPLSGENNGTLIGVEGRVFRADGTDPNADLRIVTAGYFRAMKIDVVSGQGFQEGDTYLDGTPVLISESAARLMWPDGTSPIGHRIRTGPYAPWMPIIGVVRDIKNRSLTTPSFPELYSPAGAPRSPYGTLRSATFIVRSTASDAPLRGAIQRAVTELNAELPVFNVRSYEDIIARSQVREVTTMRTLSAFAMVAIVLAITGCYAILMFTVVQRQRELALRRAIGASAANVMAMIGGEMAKLLVLATGIGIVAMVALGGVLSRFVFGVSALDPAIIGATLGVVGVVGVLAALIPARRAGLVDPMMVLRSE